MNALVKKEIRLLLPSFLIGVALAFANGFLKDDDQFGSNTLIAIVSLVACAGVAVFTALNSFGAEISAGTFSMLLAQPVSRQRIWRTKAWLLAAALFIGGFIWCAILFLRFEVFNHPKVFGDYWDIFLGTWVFLAVIYSGALWTVLLLRQMAAAFWFTLLTPGAIAMVVSGLWPEKLSYYDELVVVVALLAYSGAGIWFARRLFLRAQDVAWTGGNIAWPEMRGSANVLAGAAGKRFWRPKAALFWKEVQLHQSGFVLAGALALLHLGVLAARKFGRFQMNSSMEFILEIFWGLWLVMPMLVGAAAVAEERKLGTLAGQLCLPVKRRIQFAMKFRMVLVLSVLFGTVLPLLLEGTRILPDAHILPSGFHFDDDRWLQMSAGQSFFWYCLETINFLTPLLLLLGMATGIGAISFYASTVARNTLQALAPAVLGIIIFAFLLFNASWPEFIFHYPVWHGPLIYFIGVPVFVVVLVALSFWNCQRTDPGGSVWRRNVLVAGVALAFVMAVTTVIYHRAWEKLTPFEPAHGAARLTPSNPVTLREQWNTVSVRLADGRIWMDDYALNFDPGNPLALFLGDIRLTSLGGGHFYDGSNWVNMVRGVRMELVGIKSDGTLWASKNPAHRERLAGGGWKMSKPGDLVRVGQETNWGSLAGWGAAMLLVKTDGTLWRWGATNWSYKKEWPGLHSFTPQRLETGADWAETILADNRSFLRKTDGSVWEMSWDRNNQNQQPVQELEAGVFIQRAPYLEPGKWRSMTAIWSGLSYRLGIREDGTFRIRADQKLNKKLNSYDWTAADLQFGHGTNWLAVAGRDEKIVTLKDDGTLWLWPFRHDDWRGWDNDRDEREMLGRNPVRLGTHTDWLAITSADGGIISLAADGSLWYWPLESARRFAEDSGRFWDNHSNTYFEPLLDISRKPQRLGNVFGHAE
jgi:ABC-type transport system involved in multi-copper enzyme maturation permease subunit